MTCLAPHVGQNASIMQGRVPDVKMGIKEVHPRGAPGVLRKPEGSPSSLSLSRSQPYFVDFEDKFTTHARNVTLYHGSDPSVVDFD